MQLKWLYKAAQDRKSKGFTIQDLVHEIRDALAKKGLAFKSKMDFIKEIRASRVNIRKSFRKFKRFKRKPFKFKPSRKMFYKHVSLSYLFLRKNKSFPRSVKTTYNKRYKQRIMDLQEYREIFEFKRIKNLNDAQST